MALTDTEKAQVRRYLGFPDINRQYDLALEAAMNAISAEGETFVRDLLTELATVQVALVDARTCRLKALSVGKGEVVIDDGSNREIRALRAEGNRLAQDLGGALHVRPYRLPFSSRRGSGGIMQRG